MPPSKSKARKMLRDGKAKGKALSGKQKRYFGMVAHRGPGGRPAKKKLEDY